MGIKIGVNPPKTPVTEGSQDKSPATLPNVCKMPGPPAPFVPTPLPNLGRSVDSIADYTTTVIFEGKKVAIKGASYKSTGSADAASKGTGGGIISSTEEGKTEFAAPGSMNVKAEGKNIQLLGDAMTNNGGSPVNAGTIPGNLQGTATPEFAKAVGSQSDADKLCDAACKAMKKQLKQGETRQGAMANEFRDPNGPLYTPNNPNILPEVSTEIPGTMGGTLTTMLSTSVPPRTVPGSGGATAPMAMFKAMRIMKSLFGKGAMTRWDFVIPNNPKLPALTNNIKKFIEVKFPGDTLTDNQKAARQMMSQGEYNKIVEMHPDKDCNCK
jgi:Domain of unknown function (DUF4150)/VRR-NUC domain